LLSLNLPYHLLQLFLALVVALRVNGVALSCAVGVLGGVFTLPGVLGDLADTAGARFAFLSRLGGEFGGFRLGSWGGSRIRFGAVTVRTVEFFGGFLLHQPRDVGIRADGGFRRRMPENHGERLDIHPVFDAVGLFLSFL